MCEARHGSATITFSYDVCAEHDAVRFTGGTMEVIGVGPVDVVDGMLSYCEYLISNMIEGREDISELLSSTFPSAVKKSNGDWSFNDEDKHFLLNLLAHNLLMRQVVSREYPRGGKGAILDMTPRDDHG